MKCASDVALRCDVLFKLVSYSSQNIHVQWRRVVGVRLGVICAVSQSVS